jgi:mRNA interferase YafQ|nr:type II toxin-antitoxin system YafQ family toxin [Hallella absiana]
MMTLKLTGQFKKDLKKYKHATDLLEELEKVLKELQRNGVVSKEHNPHPLIGNYKDCMECHVKSDFLLIWFDKTKPVIKLLRLGSHSELY